MRIIVTYLWNQNFDLTLNDYIGMVQIFDHNLRSMFISAVF